MDRITLVSKKIVDVRLGVEELRGKLEDPIMSLHEVGYHFIGDFTKHFPHDAKKLYLGATKLLRR